MGRLDAANRFWSGVESRYQHLPNAVNLEDPEVAARIPVYNGVFSTINAIIIVTLLFSQGETTAGWIAVGMALVYGAATVFYVIAGRGELYIHFMLWPSLAQNIAVHIALGGFVWSGGFMLWGILNSASAALFLGRRIAFLLSGCYLGAAVLLIFLEPSLRERRDAPDIVVSAGLALNLFVVSLLILVPIVLQLVEQIRREQARSQELLLNVLPAVIADRLKRSPGVIADAHPECTVLFADIVGFTDYASEIAPEAIIDDLNLIFSCFDGLVERCGAEKIKTMGDGYLAVAGAPEERSDHVRVMCDLALQMQAAMPGINQQLGSQFMLRIGISTGGLVAGVVGTTRFSYDLWGDTVNLASRMETMSEPGTIRVTGPVALAAREEYRFEEGGMCDVKGKGQTATYLLAGTATTLAGSG